MEAAGRFGDSDPESDAAIADAIGAAVWAMDRRGVITYANRAGGELVGLTPRQLVGLPVQEFVDIGMYGPAHVVDPGPRDLRLDRLDGPPLWVSTTLKPVFDEEGHPDGAVATLVDVTDRRVVEADLRTRLDTQEVVNQFAELLLLGEDHDRAIESAAQLLARELAVPLVVLASVARDQTEVEIAAMAGDAAEEDPAQWRGRYEVPPTSATMAAVRSGDPITVLDFDESSSFQPGPISSQVDARSVACVPFAEGAACLGAISYQSRAVTEDSLFLLRSITDLLGHSWRPR
jgi:hypothetical protein